MGGMSSEAGPAPGEAREPREVSEANEGEVAANLVRRIAAGDRAAEAALVERYSRGLLYLLRRVGASPEQAEDFHQETFRIVLERLRRRGLDEPAGLAGFLHGTARNLVSAERRKAARRRTEADPAELELAVDTAPRPLDTILLAEEAAIARRLIGELPSDRDRQVLLRFYVAGDDRATICADLGLDSLHFSRVLFRARHRFQELHRRFERRMPVGRRLPPAASASAAAPPV